MRGYAVNQMNSSYDDGPMAKSEGRREPEITQLLEQQDVMIHQLSDVYDRLWNMLEVVRGPQQPVSPETVKGAPEGLSPIAERLWHHNRRLEELTDAMRRTVDSVQL